ncbi:hypothetical protein AGMMS49942_19000 [Spirochaetia bacterium]|nr:hypothetical protein AGMMS49942_19000 [Spirochaetia bacterium]
MHIRKIWGSFILLGFSLFLGGCGELGTVFESQGSYRVNALVDGEYTLDQSSIINKNSTISPFFVNSVVNDPDVRGLTVFVQNLPGAVVSRKVHYVLAGDARAATAQPEERALPAAAGTNQGAEKSGAERQDDGDTPGTTETGKTETAQTAEPPAVAVRAPEDQVLVVKQLDQHLSAFQIFENLGIGRYNLIFQVIGEKTVLYTAVKPIYFLGDADFTLGEIQSFLPGTPTGGRLIPPGTNVVLETEISADSRLDPYVMWYSGKKVIAQGRVSEGAQYLLWKTPEQTGFHTVRAEVFPLLPGERVPENITGKIKELSLAISAKSEGIRPFAGSAGDFVNWYQFRGNLDDTLGLRSGNPERQLVPLLSQKPRWVPFAGMYGLAVGPNEGYALPGKPFALSEGERGRGRISLHFASLSAGTIFTARFGDTAVLDLSLAGGNVTLHISSGTASWQESLALKAGETDTFITAIIDFEIAPDSLSASLALENPVRETKPLAIALPNTLNGEALIRLGGTEQSGTAIFDELALSYTRLPPHAETDISALLRAEEIPGEPSLPLR